MARKTKTMDGNSAAAYVSYAFTDVAAIYPITPSSSHGRGNGQVGRRRQRRTCLASEVQRNRDAVRGGRCRCGARLAWQRGALTTTYTASQGLLLMIPNMYKIAGELLPGVINVSARAVRQPCPLHLRRPFRHLRLPPDRLCHAVLQQPAGGYGPGRCGPSVRHQGPRPLPALLRRLPHLPRDPEDRDVGLRGPGRHARLWTLSTPSASTRLNPEHPVLRGTAQNPDIFFQAREACNHLLRRRSRRCRGLHEQGQREDRHQLQALQLLRRSRDARERHHRHGFCLRHHRGDDRLPQRRTATRSAWSRSACTVPSRAKHLIAAIPETVEDHHRARPHQGAGLPRRAALPGRGRRSARTPSSRASRFTPAATAWAPRTPPPPRSSPCTATCRGDRRRSASPSASRTM